MKHKDHLLLAHKLIGMTPEIWKSPVRRRAFLIGNVLPDYNPFTYLRGVRKSKSMVGHNALYSQKHVERVIRRLKKRGVRSLADCYALGTLMHYLADSFTYPHTVAFRDKMRAHNRYERELETVFQNSARCAEVQIPQNPPEDPVSFLKEMRHRYEKLPQGPATDGTQILFVCTMIYGSILQEKLR